MQHDVKKAQDKKGATPSIPNAQGDAKVNNITAAASAAKAETSALAGASTAFTFDTDATDTVSKSGVSSVVSSPGAGAFPPTPDDDFEIEPLSTASLSSSATVSVDPSDVVCCYVCDTFLSSHTLTTVAVGKDLECI